MANQVTVLLDPAQLPVRTMEQGAFDAAWAYLMTNLPTLGTQINAAVASFNAAAAGSAYAIPYTIDLSGTSDIDPGNGKLRFDNATQNLATTLRCDLLNNLGTDCTSMLDTFDASSSTIKGTIRVVKQGDATKYLIFNVTARAAPGGYRNFTVTPVANSSANPFVASDAVLLFFQRTGDKGDQGVQGLAGANSFFWLHVREEQAAGTPQTAPTLLSTGVYRRALNTSKYNTISGASLASNQVTLPAGTYEVEALAIAAIGSAITGADFKHKLALYDVTGAAYLVYGVNTSARDLDGVPNYVSGNAELEGYFTLASTKTVELRHLINTAATISAAGQSGNGTEVYTDIKITKIG